MQQYRLMHTPDVTILAEHLTVPTSAEGGVFEGQIIYCAGVERDALLVFGLRQLARCYLQHPWVQVYRFVSTAVAEHRLGIVAGVTPGVQNYCTVQGHRCVVGDAAILQNRS